MESIAATGVWLYGGTVPTTVYVVELDHDFWYALAKADGDLTPDEDPQLNAEGYLYYVRHRPGWHAGLPFWPDSPGYGNLAGAIAAAECVIGKPITWQRET